MSLKRKLVFDQNAYDDFMTWASCDKKNFFRISELLRIIQLIPYDGKGRPEALPIKGVWSRYIDKDHRLIYEVTPQEIRIISCKGFPGPFTNQRSTAATQNLQQLEPTFISQTA
ncbi:MAG: Txe/YoeB family addiction module toxin [Siphonobacter sp.]